MKSNTVELRSLRKHCAETYREMGYICNKTADGDAHECEVCKRPGRLMAVYKRGVKDV